MIGIWIKSEDLAKLPMTGLAWEEMKKVADIPTGIINLTNQESVANVRVLAKGLVFARTRVETYRTQVVSAIRTVTYSGRFSGTALALGRELGAYVVAADLVDLREFDKTLDDAFRLKIRSLRIQVTTEAGSLIQCHEARPNNWGTHAGFTRAAISAYLEETAELIQCAKVFRGWLGFRASYSGFKYGALDWQADWGAPVGVNPKYSTKDGHNVDGVLPDDQRRSGAFVWPAPKENYVWEALQGAYAQAIILARLGHPVWDWEDKALLRAVEWLYNVNKFPAEGDDTWIPWVTNQVYGTKFPTTLPSSFGKNMGFTDWTHPATMVVIPPPAPDPIPPPIRLTIEARLEIVETKVADLERKLP